MTADLYSCIGFAFLGGIFGNLIKLIDMLRKPKEDQTTLNFVYWASFFSFPLFGVFMVYAYTLDGAQLSAVAAINIGISAPLIFKSLYGQAESPSGKID